MPILAKIVARRVEFSSGNKTDSHDYRSFSYPKSCLKFHTLDNLK